MISNGQLLISRKEILDKITEADILGYYLGISAIPTLINSPLRNDKKASFSLYSPNGTEVNYIDFSTGDKGGTISLLMHLWSCDRRTVYEKIYKDMLYMDKISYFKGRYTKRVSIKEQYTLKSVKRDWRPYDKDYWESYGIPIKVLEWANVYPISHKILETNNKQLRFIADKYAYTFIEKKEGKITQKIYQPFNKNGFKWQNNHDKSVIGLWSLLPEKGKSVCICSSVKDALCLMVNLGIRCICLQGEGFDISDTAIKELKNRFINIYVCFDNDEPGLKDASAFSCKHDLINVVIPFFKEGKDISDYYKAKGKEKFKETFNKIFIQAKEDDYKDLPF